MFDQRQPWNGYWHRPLRYHLLEYDRRGLSLSFFYNDSPSERWSNILSYRVDTLSCQLPMTDLYKINRESAEILNF